ncbi:hypothetical protein Ddc_09239 [Ditylenchus destructor]|nr:hypothetical protein Ddc_09239 [Ditylenchus destructor]
MSTPEPPLIPFVRITVAVKSLKETPWSTGFSALLILESCLILSAMVIVIILLFLLIRTQFFHTNCHRLIANTAWHFLIFAVVPRYFEIAYTFYYNSKWNKMNILNVNENGMLLINVSAWFFHVKVPAYCGLDTRYVLWTLRSRDGPEMLRSCVIAY